MNITELIFVIDKSGSMSHLAKDTIGGFNSFVESQKDDVKTILTTVLFDTTCKTLHDGIDVYEVQPMTANNYIPYGGTAMLDAIGETINKVQDRHDELGSNKPNKVLFVITTDGEENSSTTFNKAQIEKMIKHQTAGHGWEFIFLGANMDAVKEAQDIGISASRSVNYEYTTAGTDALYSAVSNVAKAVRLCEFDGVNAICDMDLNSVYDSALASAKAYTDTTLD